MFDFLILKKEIPLIFICVLIERFSSFEVGTCFIAVYKSNCGSLEEVTQWVYDDLESTRSWLQQRDPKVSLFLLNVL